MNANIFTIIDPILYNQELTEPERALEIAITLLHHINVLNYDLTDICDQLTRISAFSNITPNTIQLIP